MKKVLIDKLMQLGYDTQMIYSKLSEWNVLDNGILFQKLDIPVLEFNKPTIEISATFLNLEGLLDEIFVFYGEIEEQDFCFAENVNMRVVEYSLDEELCILVVTKNQELKIVRYLPNEEIKTKYNGKKYEAVLGNERRNLMNDYLLALTSTQRVSQEKAKEILKMLASEYVIDQIILENANPKIKLYDDAKIFAENITSYKYKYINLEKNQVDFLESKKVIKKVGIGVTIGYISNEPYLSLDEVNKVSNFRLNRPAYVWLAENKNKIPELAIYTASAMYSTKTYKNWWEEKENEILIQKSEELVVKFSRRLGYEVSKDFVLSVLKKLNKELISAPEEIQKINTNNQLSFITYNFDIITETKEFESYMYTSLEDYLSGKYRYKNVENVGDNYTIIGENFNYTNALNENINQYNSANFNIKANTAVLKKETLLTQSQVSLIENTMMKKVYSKEELEKLPIPRIDVVFYFPSKNNDEEEIEMYHQTDLTEYKNNMSKVLVSCITVDGKVIKEEYVSSWSGKEFIPKVEEKLFDAEGLMWTYVNEMTPTVIVSKEKENKITLLYDKLKRKVKVKCIDENGIEIKNPKEIIGQVGEIISCEPDLNYIDNFGRHWNGTALDKINQKISENEEKNIVNMIYEKKMTAVIFSFIDELGNKVMENTSENVQVGTSYKVSLEKEIVDSLGSYWCAIEEDKEFKIDEQTYNITVQCKPMMSKVLVRYVDYNEEEIFPAKQEIAQVGSTYIPEITRTWKDTKNRSWIVSQNQKREFKVQKAEEYNQIVIKYEPVLVNVTIIYQDINGKEIKKNETIKKQLGSEWTPVPQKKIKDEKGNEWHLVEREYSALKIKEVEKENVVTFVYQVSKTNVVIKYVDIDGNALKAEEFYPMQVGNAFVPMPDNSILDKENKRWKLFKIQPAMVKVTSKENNVIVTYKPEKAKITWKFIDMDGNTLKEDEIYTAQIGEKYQPLVEQKIIVRNNEKMTLIKIEPYEIIVSEDVENNVIKLIYTKAI